MNLMATALLAAGVLILVSAFAPGESELTELGGGLVMRSDGSVVGVWELPGWSADADILSTPETAIAARSPSHEIWRTRLARGW